MLEDLLLNGAILPAVVAAVLYLATRRTGFAVGIGWLAGRAALEGWSWPGLPAKSSLDWVPWLVAAAVAVSFVPKRVPGRWIGGALLCAAAPWLLLRNTIKDDYVLLGSLGAALWIVALLVQGAARKRPGVTVPLVLALVCGGAAACFELGSSSITLAQQAGVLAAACGVLVFVVKGKDPQDAVLPAALVLAGLLLNAYYYGYPGLPLSATVLLAAAPLAAWASVLPGIKSREPWIRVASSGVAAAIPVAVAVWIAIGSAPPPNPYG